MANPIIEKINAELSELSQQLDQFKKTVDYLNGAKTEVQKSIQTVNHAETHFNKKVEELKNTYQSFLNLDTAITNLIVKISDVDFPERLENIENAIHDTVKHLDQTKKATIEELQNASEIIIDADFDGKFLKLQKTIDASVYSNNQIADIIKNQKFDERLNKLRIDLSSKLDNYVSQIQKNSKQAANEMTKSVNSLNLPIRFEKLDVNISGIMAGIQSVQSRIDNMERHLENALQSSGKSINDSINKFHTEVHASIESLFNTITKNQKRQNIITLLTAVIIIGILTTIILLKPE